MDTLFHISDVFDIVRFDPRPPPSPVAGLEGPVVWAIDHAHLHNYLLPRDCPRVTYYALPTSTPEDVARLMGYSDARYVVAIESRWVPELLRQRLYCYEFPPDTFTVLDPGAGYYISREPVIPRAVTQIDNLLTELLRHDVELRVLPSLWRLRDAVVDSTLQCMISRLRNRSI